MSSSVPKTFKGYARNPNPELWDHPELVEYKAKTLNENNIVVKNEVCGVCASDVLQLQGKFGPNLRDDLVCGHEIIGKAVWVGDNVKSIKKGDRVGLGWFSALCGSCQYCNDNLEQYCLKKVQTFNSADSFADGYVTQGGFAAYSIADELHTVKIPDGLPSEYAAPLMCGGVTVFLPLYYQFGTNAKGKRVLVYAMGGLGHMAIQLAKAIGAEVVVALRTLAKKQQALEMGAKDFVATQDDPEWYDKYNYYFDMVINCALGVDGFDINSLLATLRPRGQLVNVGIPDVDEKYHVELGALILNGSLVVGLETGLKNDTEVMLKVAAEHGVKPWVETIPISKNAMHEVLKRCNDGDVRYRFVLTDYDQGFN